MCKKAIFLNFVVWVPALLSANVAFGTSSKKASNPVPPDGATSVSTNVTVSWTPGLGAKLHTVYFGDNFDDVYNAAGGFPQATPAYTPGPLELDMTYYWRVDEFDGVERHKGDVWSFTTGTEIPPQKNVYYVDADASGNNDGSSWADAYLCLQDALADANDSPKPVEIRVAQGTYTPDCGKGYVRGDKEAKFFLKSGVTLKGGFAGVGADDPDAWDHQAYKTVLSGDLSGNDERLLENFVENSDHLVWCIEGDASAVLDGFTITGGYATDRIGGGLLNYEANPTVKRCVFFDNYASQGGGMANRASSPTVIDCTFSGNLVRYGGGGMYNTDQSHPIVESCTFHDNWSTTLGGGGMYCGDSNPIVTHCLFIGNGAPFGGGMYNAAANPFIGNCTLSNNRSNSWGGGMQNEAGSDPTVINCILWDNIPDGITTFGTVANVTYSNVQGGHIGEGNMDTDPLFANPNGGDYHLKSEAGRWDAVSETWIMDETSSRCIDAGDPDDPIAEEPYPNGGVINMGAYGGTVEASKSLSSVSEEDFESNDFSTFPWEHHGDASWTVTSYEKNSGAYSAQADTIDHDESTTLQVRVDCISGDITFYRKVSSEQGCDFLEFYIDGVNKGEWSGTTDWDQVSFPVTTGTRTFEWTYSKDGSVSEDDDTAWIDDIVFPTGADTDAVAPGLLSDPELTLYYSFDEVTDIVLDQSGNGHDGVVIGDVTLDPEGMRNGAAKFATGSYLDLDGPSIPSEHIPTTGITLAAWVKCEYTGGHHAIFNARAADATWLIHPELRSNDEFRWLLRTAGGNTIFDIRTGEVTWDEWLHFCGMYDQASGRAALYIDGELIQEQTVPTRLKIARDWGSGARVGRNIDNLRPFTGLMDMLWLFRRSLSEGEIPQAMQGGIPL